MTMSANLHTEDLLNKHPVVVELKHWNQSGSDYIALQISQLGAGEVTIFVQRRMYCDLIAGLEDAARQLRGIVAREMVKTWGFPVCPCYTPEDPGTTPAEDTKEAARP